jgi:hypothetical protein
MSNIDRRKLMIGGAVGAASMSVVIPALAEQEGVALSGTITEFYQFLVKLRALPPIAPDFGRFTDQLAPTNPLRRGLSSALTAQQQI